MPDMSFQLRPELLTTIPVAILAWCAWSYFADPLKRYPGPFVARWTNLWRTFGVRKGDFHETVRELHQKHGPVVRLGPNILDLDLPLVIKTIYNAKGNFTKSEFYPVASVLMNGRVVHNMFTMRDNAEHARNRRPIAQYYSPKNVVAFEQHVDNMTEELCRQLEARYVRGPNSRKVFDLSQWVTYFTWDVMSAVTFSQSFGYLEAGSDHDGTLATSDLAIDYFAWVSQLPWIDDFLGKNRLKQIGPPGFGNVTNIAVQRMVARLQGADKHDAVSQPDYLDRFMEAKAANADMTDVDLIGYLMSNVIAGADTTAITIRSILYYLLKNPAALGRATAEIDAAGVVRDGRVTAADSRSLTYLEAVIRESMRIHPPTALTMERYVPAEGLNLPDGLGTVPAGTIVGMNAYIISHNPTVYGPDVDNFRPERWLRDEAAGETTEAYAARLQLMNGCDITFGGGSRSCLGQHFSLMETFKVIAVLLATFRFELAEPKKEWHTINSWFWRQDNINVRISKRRPN